MSRQKARITEFIQRSENGGSPLDNETAHNIGIGHGTPMVMMPTREFVALLKESRESAIRGGPNSRFVKIVQGLINEFDKFAEEVKPEEFYGKEME